MASHSFPAIFVRGGTSNGLLINRDALPPQNQWHTVLPAAMGSPDPYGRQLNGMGSGVSSTSKICVLAPSTRDDADVEFTFVQIGIRDGAVDTAGSCGNMSSAVGPVTFDEGLVPHARIDRDGDLTTATVRIFNTNTAKIIHSRFRVAGNPPRYCPEGDYEMDGVPGTGSRITLSFLRPAGAKTGKALPTGNPVDTLTLPDGSTIPASLVDVSNPGVFVRLSDLGLPEINGNSSGSPLDPAAVEANPALKARLEHIRRAGATMMGLNPDVESVPKIVLVFPKATESAPSSDVDFRCLGMSMGQAHKAVPLTLALCLGAASKIGGTVVAQLIQKDGGGKEKDVVAIGHPSGKLDISTTLDSDGSILSAELMRTARVLMKGEVFY